MKEILLIFALLLTCTARSWCQVVDLSRPTTTFEQILSAAEAHLEMDDTLEGEGEIN